MRNFKNYLISTDKVKPLDVGEEEGFKGVDSRLLICDETVGDTTSCLFRAVFPPGAYHGNHVHSKSDELLFCISGEAIQAIEGVEYIIKPGDAMIIPKGKAHWMKNVSDKPFIVIGIYPNAKNFEDSDQHLVKEK
jgi:quercetin dioxygenase-like cupin family protein